MPERLVRPLIPFVAVISLLATGATATEAPSEPPIGCAPAFTHLEVPHQGGVDLSGLSIVSDQDVWVVGSSPHRHPGEPLAEHWGASGWTDTPTPDLAGSEGGMLLDVDGVAAEDVWAVGYELPFDRLSRPLAEHWDGSAWTLSPFPSPPLASRLTRIDAISPDQAWAVGWRRRGQTAYPLVARWNGSSWTIVHTGFSDLVGLSLTGVAAVRADDVWVVGTASPASGSRTFTAHWDGSDWRVVRAPNPGSSGNLLTDVSAGVDGSVWAVGEALTPGYSGDDVDPLILRWDADPWASMEPPAFLHEVPLGGVAAVSRSNVWAFGEYGGAAHWDGLAWQEVELGYGTRFERMDASSSGDVWAIEGDGVARACPIRVGGGGFSPRTAHLVVGQTVAWVLAAGSQAQQLTDASGLELFDVTLTPPTGSFVFTLPGAGGYRVREEGSGARALATVEMVGTSIRNGSTTFIYLTWGVSEDSEYPTLPEGLAADVQVSHPGEKGFSDWLFRTRSAGSVFFAKVAGLYRFRARIRRSSTPGRTLWSPVFGIQVEE